MFEILFFRCFFFMKCWNISKFAGTPRRFPSALSCPPYCTCLSHRSLPLPFSPVYWRRLRRQPAAHDAAETWKLWYGEFYFVVHELYKNHREIPPASSEQNPENHKKHFFLNIFGPRDPSRKFRELGLLACGFSASGSPWVPSYDHFCDPDGFWAHGVIFAKATVFSFSSFSSKGREGWKVKNALQKSSQNYGVLVSP